MEILLNEEMLDSENWHTLLKMLELPGSIHSVVFEVTSFSAYGNIEKDKLSRLSLDQVRNEFNN